MLMLYVPDEYVQTHRLIAPPGASILGNVLDMGSLDTESEMGTIKKYYILNYAYMGLLHLQGLNFIRPQSNYKSEDLQISKSDRDLAFTET